MITSLRHRTGVLIALLLLMPLIVWANSRWLPLPYSSRLVDRWIPWTVSPAQVFCFDPVNQGFDIACFTSNEFKDSKYLGSLLIKDDLGQIFDQVNVTGAIEDVAGRDIDGDRVQEIVVSYCDSTMAAIRIFGWPDLMRVIGEFVLRSDEMSEFLPRERSWDSKFRIGPVVDGILPDRPALILALVSGFGQMPRGILAVDPLTGTEIWHYWIAVNVPVSTPFYMVQLVGSSGDPVIVVGTNAPFNGTLWNGTSDKSCYLLALDRRGTLLWRKEFPGPFSSVSLHPVERPTTGTSEVYAYYTCAHAEGPPDRLMRINVHTGQIVRDVTTGDSGRMYFEIHPWIPAKDSTQQILVQTGMTEVSIYDPELQLVNRRPLSGPGMLVADINGDGAREILTSSVTGWQVYDRDFRLLHECRDIMQFGPVAVQRSRNTRFSRLFFGTSDGISCHELFPNPARRQAWFSMAGTGAGIVGFSVAGRWWLAKRRRKKVQARIEQERREAWAAMASKLAHDVRTPLSVLRLSAQNLELELKAKYGQVPEDLQAYLRRFTSEVDRVSAVTQAFLKFARLSPPKLESVNLAELVREVVERHPHPSRITVEFRLESDLPRALADRQQLATLIENLLSNSFKATKAEGRLTISLFWAQDLQSVHDHKGWFVLEVQDTGKGISKDDLPRVFDPYFSRSEGGTGLGLPIVKKIVEDHKGSVEIESTVGLGTTVRVKLPNLACAS